MKRSVERTRLTSHKPHVGEGEYEAKRRADTPHLTQASRARGGACACASAGERQLARTRTPARL